MTSPLLESRRQLRKCAFQASRVSESGTDVETVMFLPILMIVKIRGCATSSLLTEPVSGVRAVREERAKITQHLKAGWTIER